MWKNTLEKNRKLNCNHDVEENNHNWIIFHNPSALILTCVVNCFVGGWGGGTAVQWRIFFNSSLKKDRKVWCFMTLPLLVFPDTWWNTSPTSGSESPPQRRLQPSHCSEPTSWWVEKPLWEEETIQRNHNDKSSLLLLDADHGAEAVLVVNVF